jgi:hypothetical protein
MLGKMFGTIRDVVKAAKVVTALTTQGVKVHRFKKMSNNYYLILVDDFDVDTANEMVLGRLSRRRFSDVLHKRGDVDPVWGAGQDDVDTNGAMYLTAERGERASREDAGRGLVQSTFRRVSQAIAPVDHAVRAAIEAGDIVAGVLGAAMVRKGHNVVSVQSEMRDAGTVWVGVSVA